MRQTYTRDSTESTVFKQMEPNEKRKIFMKQYCRAAHRTVTVVGRMSTAVFVGLSTLHGTARLTPVPYREP